MNVIYLTWGETPRAHGVFGSQVLKQFIANKNHSDSSDEYFFISALPIIHSGLIRERFSYIDELNKVKNLLKNITFDILLIYAPQNFVNSNRFTFTFFHLITHWFLARKFKKIKPNIVHCRSYHAAWAAMEVKRKYHFNYKVIFDARSLWPEAVSLLKKYHENGKNYHFLKELELDLLKRSDAVITVSNPMTAAYNKIVNREYSRIYLSSSVKDFSNIYVDRSSVPDVVNFCYVGALEENSWHKTSELCKLLKYLSTIVQSNFKIITTSNHIHIKNALDNAGIVSYTLIQTKTSVELAEALQNQHFGLLSYFNPDSFFEKNLAKTVLAVKTVEYLAAGMPVICNVKCEGAAEIINENGVGITYTSDNMVELNRNNIYAMCTNQKISRVARTLASELFDYEVNAKKYHNLYQDLF